MNLFKIVLILIYTTSLCAMEHNEDLMLITKGSPDFITVYHKTMHEIITINLQSGKAFYVVERNDRKASSQELTGTYKSAVYSKEYLENLQQLFCSIKK
jgi:hypothetical protein